MTIREFLEKVIENENVEQELKDFANERILKLDQKNARRKSTPSKTQKENEPIKQAILEFLEEQEEDATILASDVAEALEITTSKASGLLVQLKNNDLVVSKSVRIAKKGERLAWSIVDKEISE